VLPVTDSSKCEIEPPAEFRGRGLVLGLLAARGLGLGASLTTMHKFHDREVKELLDIPENVETVALIPVGYPIGKYGPTTRLPVEKITHWERWGVREP
jgi:hypothetical protein